MTISQFLLHLATHPQKLEQFRANPEAELEKADLTREQKQLLRSAKLRQIRVHVETEFEVAGEDQGFVIVFGGLRKESAMPIVFGDERESE